MRLIRRSCEESLSDRSLKAVREELTRDSQMAMPLLEPPQSEKRIAQDEQRPSIADHVQCSRQ